MKVLLIHAGRVVNWVEAPDVPTVQSKVGALYLCLADPLNGPTVGWLYDGTSFTAPTAPTPPRTIMLTTFLLRIPRAKRNAMRVARTTDANLDDALALLYTYATIALDSDEVRAFVTLLRTGGHITLAEALALLA